MAKKAIDPSIPRQSGGRNGAEKGENEGVKGKKIRVSVDTPLSDVLRYDQEGAILSFDVSDGRFLSLDEETIRKLSQVNRTRYDVAADMAEDLAEDNEDESLFLGISIGEDQGQAQARLDVEGLPEDMMPRWERPDRLDDRLREGYKIVKRKGVKTLSNPNGNPTLHTITRNGQTELLLIAKPKELAKQKQAARVKRWKERSEGVYDSAKDDLRRGGIEGYQEDEVSQRVKFTPPARD